MVGLLCARPAAAEEPSSSPRAELDFLQYGAAFTAESQTRSGGICPSGARERCILGSGGGFVVRVGHRSQEGWFLGGAYEFSKHDSANLLNLGILQQLRAEARRYLVRGSRFAPYVLGSVGAAGYGNEWAVETYGFATALGIGIEYESTREVFVGLAPAYRAIWLRSWQDKAGQERNGGVAHFIGLELTLEVRSAFARW